MKKNPGTKRRKPSAGRRIIASLQEAVDWVEGKNVAVRVTTVEVPVIDVRAYPQALGAEPGSIRGKVRLSAGHSGNWEQGRTTPDGPAPYER